MLLAGDEQQSGDVIGFHAQQAVEKAIKAVLVALSFPLPPRTIWNFLLDVLAEHSVAVPDAVADADWLTPWAVAARYGATEAALDREVAVRAADDAVTSAEATVT